MPSDARVLAGEQGSCRCSLITNANPITRINVYKC